LIEVLPATASEKVGGVSCACSAFQCGENRREPRATPAVTAGETAIQFTSGDGLGIHQPGSTVPVTPRRQGRARDRVICPAVARSSLCA
jgi:hypothetical protein